MNPDNLNKCFYCGEYATFYSKATKRWRCNEYHARCPEQIKKAKDRKISVVAVPFMTDKLCKYNCGELAKYIFKDGSLCCCSHTNKCISVKSKQSIKSTGRTYTPERNMKISIARMGKSMSAETRKKL